ncbi:MAG: hypothetical protein KF683_22775 [Rubrivivax sp.]|nr:hypothetical protein [Rubrivivax sp.]
MNEAHGSRRAWTVAVLLLGAAALLAACSSVRVGVGLPIGRIGGASVSVGSDGSVGGSVGVGSGGVSVGVGASGRLPEKSDKPAAKAAEPAASAASSAAAAADGASAPGK